MPQAISDAEFEREVLKSDVPVFVDFWAPWCGPCRAMNPIIEELEGEYKGKVKFMKINVDENSVRPEEFKVLSIPTFMIFRGGEAATSFVGARSKEDVKKEIDSAIA